MQLAERKVLFPSDKQWVVEIHIEGSPNYCVCKNWGEIANALEDALGVNPFSPNVNKDVPFWSLEDITIAWKEMSQQEIDELPEFEGF